jgi:rhamnulokinase
MTSTSCAAIDLGAASGRVAVADFDGDRIVLREAGRFETPSLTDPGSGHLCWDVDAIEARVRERLAAACRLAPLSSIGVDSWGVDYVLVDGDGRRVAPAVSYRDERTRGVMEEVFARVPADEIYRRTGIQFLPLNTLYQLAATSRDRPEWLARASHLLLLPCYVTSRLCGALVNEYTHATTTQVYRLAGDGWDEALLAAVGVPRALLVDAVEPGTVVGELPAAAGAPRVQVVMPGTHDTASAVAAIPLAGPDEVFISSGTWSLMGIESARPHADAAARRLNFSNEGGVERRYRVLKNILGLWIAQRLREELGAPDHGVVVAAAEAAPPWRCLVDPADPRFVNPPSMVAALSAFCAETGQPDPGGLGGLARCAFESLALSYRRVKLELEEMTGRPMARVRIVGGGSRNRLLDQLCADACQLPVSAGPVETSVLGNACVQLIALGALGSLAEARALVSRSFPAEEFLPRGAVPGDAWARFQAFRAGPPAPEERPS